MDHCVELLSIHAGLAFAALNMKEPGRVRCERLIALGGQYIAAEVRQWLVLDRVLVLTEGNNALECSFAIFASKVRLFYGGERSFGALALLLTELPFHSGASQDMVIETLLSTYFATTVKTLESCRMRSGADVVFEFFERQEGNVVFFTKAMA